jgi:UDP:flavonoid glycosyltransferase YjiC (YdhE family)
LRRAVQSILEEEKYRAAAHNIMLAMRQVNGLNRAADIIEDALNIRIPQRGPSDLFTNRLAS